MSGVCSYRRRRASSHGPAAIVRAESTSRLILTANDLGPAMISAVKHAASIRNPEFDARQRARRSTWDTPRFLYSYDETADGDLVLPAASILC